MAHLKQWEPKLTMSVVKDTDLSAVLHLHVNVEVNGTTPNLSVNNLVCIQSGICKKL